MLYGDQWDCKCGWSNLTLRKRCRNCGTPRSDAPTVPFLEVLPEIERACAAEAETTEPS